MKKLTTVLSAVAVLALGAQAASLEDRVKTLESQNVTLTEEVLAAQTAGFTMADPDKSFGGLGPAASKVYFSETPLSMGGYGEMYYANPEGGDDFTDVYRFITYIGYRFNDNVLLNIEIEYEHGDTSRGGKVLIEFFYLAFLINEKFNVRLGHLLVPMGLINLRHEPTLFHTVQRPSVEKFLLPSTWHETGVKAFGSFADVGLDYQVALVNALNADNPATTGGVDADGKKISQFKWIRNGRLGSSNKGSFAPAFVARLDYVAVPGLVVGGSVYHGEGTNSSSKRSVPALGTSTDGLTTTIFEGHVAYNSGPITFNALYTQTNLDGAENFNVPGAATQGDGYYVNASYDVGSLMGLDYVVPVFAQYEDFNPVSETLDGSNEDLYHTQATTVGVNWFLTEQVSLKVDYLMETSDRRIDNDNKKGEHNMLSLGLAFIY